MPRSLPLLAVFAACLVACETSSLLPGGAGGAGFATGGTSSGAGGLAGSGSGPGSGGDAGVGGSPGSGGSLGSGGAGGSAGGASGGAAAGGAPTGGAGSGSGGGSVGTGGEPGEAWLSPGETVRILPLGDSITAEGSCWRHDLWGKLEAAGYVNIDFVGSQTASDCGGGYDSDHEGHGGVLVTNVTPAEMSTWFSAANADVVLLHFATNDVWNDVSTEEILGAHLEIVTALRAVNPDVIVLEAQIIPMSEDQCAPCQTSIPALNAAMPAWAGEHSTSSSPIFVVDQYTGFDSEADTSDGVHPYTTTGADKMASRWFDAIVALY